MTARRGLQTFAAVIVGVMLVTAAALGGAWMTNPNVDDIDDATNQFVSSSDAIGVTAVGATMAIAAGVYKAAEYLDDHPDTEGLQKADALETKKAIYDQLSIQAQNNDIINTAYSNYLEDTQSIALMTAKNAYIRALENGTSEPVARNKANEAAADYYSVKQKNIIAAWNTSVIAAEEARQTASNTTGMAAGYVEGDVQRDSGWLVTESVVNEFYSSVTTYNLANATTATVPTVAGYTGKHPTPDLAFNSSYVSVSTGSTSWRIGTFMVRKPNQNFQNLTFTNVSKFRNKWRGIQEQNRQVQAQMDTFIDNTYSSYQQGGINVSDLVDPYLGGREYAPEDAGEYQSWSLRTLTSLGLNAPENLSSTGRMVVLSGGTEYTGILMTDENPQGGFTVGETYNATALNGSQFVALDDGSMQELGGEFTLKSATTSDGQTIAENESITYNNVTYKTANTTEFKRLQSQLGRLQAEINARQDELRNSGGGFLPDFGLGFSGGLGVPVTLLLVAGGAVLVLGRD